MRRRGGHEVETERELRLAVHDTSRLEWTVELPLPSGRQAEDFSAELVLEIPAAIWTDHESWSHLQLHARLASPHGESEGEAIPGSADELRRSTLAAVHRLKAAREALEHEIFTAASLFSRAARTGLGEDLRGSVDRALAEAALDRGSLEASSSGEAEELARERALAAEFLSNHLLDFLSRVQRAIDEGLTGPRCRHREEYGEVARGLRPELARALAAELRWRGERGLLRPDPADPEALERYVERASLLKKHFQELLFLQAETELVDRRFKNWFAVAAAMLAAFWAFPLGIILTTDRMAGVGLGFSATLVLFSVMYAVKDRIKESVRGWLADRIIRNYGGRTTTLLTPARLLAVPARLARLRESFALARETRPDPLNPDVGAARPVAVLRYAARGVLEGDVRLAWQGLHGVKLVFRYDLSPLFARLDDAVKRVPVLADDGQTVRFAEAPRAYRIPVALSLRHGTARIREEGVLVAHKLGLERLDRTGRTEAAAGGAPAPRGRAEPAPAGDGALGSIALSGAPPRR